MDENNWRVCPLADGARSIRVEHSRTQPPASAEALVGRALARKLAWLLLLFIGAISVFTPLAHERIAERWFTWPSLLWFSPVPLLVVLSVRQLLSSLRDDDSHAAPFLLTLALVFLGYRGLGISLWPNIVPPDISIRVAA